MNRSKRSLVALLLLVVAMLACAIPTPTPPPVATVSPFSPTQPPLATQPPTPETRPTPPANLRGPGFASYPEVPVSLPAVYEGYPLPLDLATVGFHPYIELNDGQTIRAKVVAENNAFYVIERFNEVRSVPLDSIKSVEWADGSRPANLRGQDQLLLENGHVISGTITDEKDEPAYFQVKSSISDFTYVVFKAEVKKAYKGGAEYPFTVPEPGGSE